MINHNLLRPIRAYLRCLPLCPIGIQKCVARVYASKLMIRYTSQMVFRYFLWVLYRNWETDSQSVRRISLSAPRLISGYRAVRAYRQQL